jgi:hypothetical protein
LDIAALNNSGIPILQGQVVRQTGFVQPQQVPSIALASATSSSTSTVFGLAVTDIADNTIGQIRISGAYSPIDTTGYIQGQIVYLSNTSGDISSTPGNVTSVVGTVQVVGNAGCIYITCRPASSTCDTGGGAGATGVAGSTGIQGATGIGSGGGGGTGASNTLNMNLHGLFSNAGALPAVNLGPELTGGPTTYVDFRARRAVPGNAGATVIELELNGVPTGDTLSWTPADGAFALKSTVIVVAVVAGDRLSFRMNSRESGPARDIYAEVNA